MIAEIEGETCFVRLLAVILVCGKENPADEDDYSEYRFIGSRMMQPDIGCPKSYLPYGLYHHDCDSARGVKTYNLTFLDEAQVLRPAICFPNPGGMVGYGNLETKAVYHSSVNQHYFACIDTARFQWPKEVSFNFTFYTNLRDDDSDSRPGSMYSSVFLDPDDLKSNQISMGLETSPPLLKRRKLKVFDDHQVPDAEMPAVDDDDSLCDDELDDGDKMFDPVLFAWVKS